MRLRPSCSVCRKLKQSQNKQVSCDDGGKCEFLPPLMPQNEDAIGIWSLVYWQRIYVGNEGISIDIDHSAVWKAIEKYKVQDDIGCFEKVLMVFQKIKDLEDQEREEERLKDKYKIS